MGEQRGSVERRDSAAWPDWAFRAQSSNGMTAQRSTSTISAAVMHSDSSEGVQSAEEGDLNPTVTWTLMKSSHKGPRGQSPPARPRHGRS